MAQHEGVLHALLAQLAPPASAAAVRLAVRKRAIVTLGALVAFCSPALLAVLYERLLAELAAERAPALQVLLHYLLSSIRKSLCDELRVQKRWRHVCRCARSCSARRR